MARRIADITYWVLVSFCLIIGLLGILSIGMPFLLLGVLLAALAPVRGEAHRFWPPLIGLALFVFTYVLVAPLGCTVSASVSVVNGAGPRQITQEIGSTSCTNLLGLDYSGTGTYNPPLRPALLAAVVLGTLTFLIAQRMLRTREAA
jgi:uncharacterized membrane-anchored protein